MPYGDGPAMASLDNAFDAAELDLLMGWVVALALTAFSSDCLESRDLVVVAEVVVEDWGVCVSAGAGAGAGLDV